MYQSNEQSGLHVYTQQTYKKHFVNTLSVWISSTISWMTHPAHHKHHAGLVVAAICGD